MRPLIPIAIALTISSGMVAAEELNITRQLNESLLNGKDKLFLRWEGQTFDAGNYSGDIYSTTFTDRFGNAIFIRYANPRFVQKEILFSKIESSGIPDSIAIEDLTWRNCTKSGTVPVNDTLTINFTEGATVVAGTSIVDSASIVSGGNIGLKIGAINAGFNIQETVNHSTTTRSDTTTNLTKGKSDVRVMKFDVPSMTARRVKVEKRLTTDAFSYDGIFIIDADVYARGRRSDGVYSEGEVSYGTVSSYTPEEAPRTFHLKGRVFNITGTSSVRTDTEYSLEGRTDICSEEDSQGSKVIKSPTPKALL